MATSRTGTGKWKSVRRRKIREAQDAGLTHCPMPGCGRPLDFTNPYRPESAEVDHIVSHANGGRDSVNNARVICRDCNGRRGDGRREARAAADRAAFPTSRRW